jgi:predicted DNA-binding protein YlxM (UPF0122 family)
MHKQKMVKIDTDELISITTAAKLRGVSQQAMSDMVKRGKIAFTEIDGVKFLKRDEVLNFVKSKGGRPKKDENKTNSKQKVIDEQMKVANRIMEENAEVFRKLADS